MEPLSIQDLKNLSVEEWLWIEYNHGEPHVWSRYFQKHKNSNDLEFHPQELNWDRGALLYEDYGKIWWAYKNKEFSLVIPDEEVPTDIRLAALQWVALFKDRYIEQLESENKELRNTVRELRGEEE